MLNSISATRCLALLTASLCACSGYNLQLAEPGACKADAAACGGEAGAGSGGAKDAGSVDSATRETASGRDAGTRVSAEEMTQAGSGGSEGGRTGEAGTAGASDSSAEGGRGGNRAMRDAAAGSSGTASHDDPSRSSTQCGNGKVEAGEMCDGNCPTTCPPAKGCVVSTLSGSAATCDAECQTKEITDLKNGDQCCPNGASASSDSDCPVMCGDGVLDATKLCDPKSTEKPCPSSCDDDDPCTKDMLTGSAAQCTAQCVHTPITAAKGGDGCCPDGANANTDSDCKPVCGNGTIEGSEKCDGNCPTSCSASSNSCTTSTLSGSAARCNAECIEKTVGTPKWYFQDCDGDGYAPQSTGMQACSDPPAMGGCGWTNKQPLGADADCDDHAATRHPGADFGLPLQAGGGGLPPARDFAYDLNCDGQQEFTVHTAVTTSNLLTQLQSCSGSPTCGGGQPDCIASYKFMGDIVCGQSYGVMLFCGGAADVYWLCK